jgi:hypothetical protein
VFNVLFARHLTSLLPPGSPLVANSASPGMTRTSFMRKATFPVNYIMALGTRIFGRDANTAARIVLWGLLAGDSDAHLRDELRGAYVGDGMIMEAADKVVGPGATALAERVWVRSNSPLPTCLRG